MKPAPMIEWLEEFTTDGDRVDVKAVVEAKKGFVLSGALFVVNIPKSIENGIIKFYAMPLDLDGTYCCLEEMCDVELSFMGGKDLVEFVTVYIKFIIEGGKFENKDFT